ncbi:glycosyltransferase [Pedobacter puniceum]|uniref:Glycosyltransferase n=1 Tax=Pedobacter puniceum TaxID=2666136 RepID=A0A7K0FTJ3_9SPHI|nr:glycosyltransferase [Pedobacter puniceum]MRX48660.1 glycosyltransferase [Pedobacter puniceum]
MMQWKDNMNITYFHRNSKGGYSIAKVSNTFITEFKKDLNVLEFEMPHHKADLFSVIKNIYYIFNNRNKTGINHITGDIHYGALGLIGCKTVLTIHDLSAHETNDSAIKRFIIKFLWFKLPLLFVNKIVCISEETKIRLEKIVKKKEILVIPNAVDSTFSVSIKEFNTSEPTILQIGTAWNKNVKNLILAVKHIKCQLIIVGQINKELELLLNKNQINYKIRKDLSDREIIEEYKNSDIVAFVSLYEGFGMPIIEANATGRAIITSNISPMNQIANDSALLVNPNNVEEIKNGIIKIINDKEYRESIINKGILNAKKYNVELICKQYEEVYKSLL